MEIDNNLKDLIQSLETLVLEYKFDEASKLLINVDQLTIAQAIQALGFNQPGVLAYVFVSFLINNEEKAIYHYIASLLMSYAFNYLPGAYLASYYHSKRAIELDPSNIDFKESLLYLRVIPEQIVDKEEATQIAEEVIKAKPDSHNAKVILGLK